MLKLMCHNFDILPTHELLRHAVTCNVDMWLVKLTKLTPLCLAEHRPQVQLNSITIYYVMLN